MKPKLNYYLVIAFCAISLIFQSCKKSDDEVAPQIIKSSDIQVTLPSKAKEKQTITLTWPKVAEATSYKIRLSNKSTVENGREETFEKTHTVTEPTIKVSEVPCGNVYIYIEAFKGDEKIGEEVEKTIETICPEGAEITDGKDWKDSDLKESDEPLTSFKLNDLAIPLDGSFTSTVEVNPGQKNWLRVPVSTNIEKLYEQYFIIDNGLKLNVKGIEGSYLVLYFDPEANSSYTLTISKDYLSSIDQALDSDIKLNLVSGAIEDESDDGEAVKEEEVDQEFKSSLDISEYTVREVNVDTDNKLSIIINKPHDATVEVRYVIVDSVESDERPESEFKNTVYYTEYAPGEVNSKSAEPLFVTSNPDQKDFVIQARVYDVANKTWGPITTHSVTLN